MRAKINEKTTLKFAGDEVESWWDATCGSGSGPRIAAGPALPVTTDCNHIMLWMKQGASISIRASGTEPKIKVRNIPICVVIGVCGFHGVWKFTVSIFKL